MRPSRAAGQIHQQKLLLLLAWLVGLSSGPGCRPRSPCLKSHSRHWRRCAGSQPCRHRSRPDPHAHELVVICTASSLPSSCPLHRRGAPAQIKRGRHSPAPNLVGDNQARAAVPSPHPSEVKKVGAKPPPGRRRWRPTVACARACVGVAARSRDCKPVPQPASDVAGVGAPRHPRSVRHMDPCANHGGDDRRVSIRRW